MEIIPRWRKDFRDMDKLWNLRNSKLRGSRIRLKEGNVLSNLKLTTCKYSKFKNYSNGFRSKQINELLEMDYDPSVPRYEQLHNISKIKEQKLKIFEKLK